MTFFLLTVSFILGAIVASFVGVVVARLNTGESIARGRSRCDTCARPLTGFDLVPVISYLAAGGRARCCGARLSSRAPLTELALGCLYALAYASLGATLALLALDVALALILALALYDLAHLVLPAALLAPFLLVALLFAWLTAPAPSAFLVVCATSGVLALILALMHFLSGGRWMGLADAPLALGLALIAGPSAIDGFVYSFWIGAVIGILLLLGRPRGSRMGVEVPFAPFLALGFLLAYFTAWNPFFAITVLLARISGAPLP